MSTKKQGFASMTPEKHLELSSKGGKAKVPKGFAKLSPEDRTVNAVTAINTRWNKVRKERYEQTNVTPES